jgi:MOSC domain-containing protein YiiM
VQVNRKAKQGRSRGIPKQAVARITITSEGVEGDFNRWRTDKANGDPDQAVLLLRDEILSDLRAEGWPVQRGELGENVTVAGVPDAALASGVKVRAGEVVLELSKPCDPCIVLYSLPYVGAERGPSFIRTLRGRRGWFARVIQGGTVQPEMIIEIDNVSLPLPAV